MKGVHFFTDRPIFSTVLALLIVLLGALSYNRLPLLRYPDVAPPQVQVRANYPGANAQVVTETVAAPIEEVVNGVQGMIFMSSQSTSNGSYSLNVNFEPGTDLDQAVVLVENRLARALPRLPEEVRRIGVTTGKQAPDFLLAINLQSPDESRDPVYIASYAERNLIDRLRRTDGVGRADIFGASRYAMRIWLDPDRITARNLTVNEVLDALRTQNLAVASGSLNRRPQESQDPIEFTVETTGRLPDEDAFRAVVVKSDPQGRLVFLRDIARIEIAAESYGVRSFRNGEPSVGIIVRARPDANALATAAAAMEAIEEMSQDFPPGLVYDIPYNPSSFAQEAIDAVFRTITQAIILVVLVIALFLQSWRAAFIPVVLIPISLIGSFAGLAVLGLSLNLLTLFGLVLAIGLVVDDAIIVVENMERNLASGLNARESAHRTMDEVSTALIATSLVLIAVFAPTLFFPGIAGAFFQQFGASLVVATIISLVVSLTLSPALGALLLRKKRETWLAPLRWFNRAIEGLTVVYTGFTRRLIALSPLGAGTYLVLIIGTVFAYGLVPQTFVPQRDAGYVFVPLQLPPGSSTERTIELTRSFSKELVEVDGVRDVVAFAGIFGGTFTQISDASIIIPVLEPFSERYAKGRDANAIIGDLWQKVGTLDQAIGFVFPPPPVRGIGGFGGFNLILQDRAGIGLDSFKQALDDYIGAANQLPETSRAFTLWQANTPKVELDIDYEKAQRLGIDALGIKSTLASYLGSSYVNDFTFQGRSYRVTAQAEGEDRQRIDDIERIRVRNADGAMVPLGAFASAQETTGPYRLRRYNLYPAAQVQGSSSDGFSSSQTLLALERLAEETLPAGMGYEWTGLSLQERNLGNTGLIAFALAVVFVFLLLAAQFESWTLPLAIILIVPMCLLSALLGLWLTGIENSVITQIGFVVLVGLASKNAILIVEFAKQKEDQGMTVWDAAVEAARLRLRPILMTALSFIIGVLPLVFAAGAGAEVRRAIGTTVFYGMTGVTLFGLIFTPLFYVLCRRLPHAFTLLLALFASGCNVGRVYEAPQLEPFADYRLEEAAHPRYTEAEPNDPWWSALEDPQLTDLIESAFEENRTIKLAVANLMEARARLKGTGYDKWPTVTAAGDYTYNYLSRFTTAGSLTDRSVDAFDTRLDMTWELDLFGRVSAAIAADRALAEAQEAALEDVLISVAAEVGFSYMDLRGAQTRLAVAQRNADNQRRTLEFSQKLNDLGAGNALDVNRNESLLKLTEATLPALEEEISRAINRLAVLTGRDIEQLREVLRPVEPLPNLPRSIAVGELADMLRRRPDVRRAERELASAVSEYNVNVADLYPRISLNGNIGFFSTLFSQWFTGSAFNLNFGPRIDWAAFDLGRVYARIDEADARALGALASFEQTVLLALEEIDNAMTGFVREEERRAQLRLAAEASARAEQIARNRYEAGIDSALDLLNAEATLLIAESSLAESEQALGIRLLALYKALGV